MSDLYPLLLIPIFDERPWGVRDLRPVYTRVVKEPIGESWLTWQDNRVANGPLAGRPLGELCAQYGSQIVGQPPRCGDRFPLLIKFLFPGDKLSVQVHPDDEQAHKIGQPCGKTECWYVVEAQSGAKVALGLQAGVTVAQFAQAIEQTRAEQLLNWIDVHVGDLLYVGGGTVHTIGGGMVLVETQQTSDTTYRLYDYGRPRELHVAEGLAAIRLDATAGKVVRRPGDAASLLVRSPFFQVEKFSLRAPMAAKVTRDSPHILVALSGSGMVEAQAMQPISISAGDAVVVPACVPAYDVRPQWELEMMRMSLPAGTTAQPETMLEHSAAAP